MGAALLIQTVGNLVMKMQIIVLTVVGEVVGVSLAEVGEILRVKAVWVFLIKHLAAVEEGEKVVVGELEVALDKMRDTMQV